LYTDNINHNNHKIATYSYLVFALSSLCIITITM
jgi:hypothetical protein